MERQLIEVAEEKNHTFLERMIIYDDLCVLASVSKKFGKIPHFSGEALELAEIVNIVRELDVKLSWELEQPSSASKIPRFGAELSCEQLWDIQQSKNPLVQRIAQSGGEFWDAFQDDIGILASPEWISDVVNTLIQLVVEKYKLYQGEK